VDGLDVRSKKKKHMPGCVFSLSGSDLDLDEALSLLTFQPYMTHRRGDPIEGRPGHFYEDSGLSVMASEASGDQLWRQLDEADAFLSVHGPELAKISGIEDASLDFGYFCRIGMGPDENRTIVQGEHIEPSLLKKCGELGIGISLSLYPPSEPDSRTESEQGGDGDA